jgi:hypothetical protein
MSYPGYCGPDINPNNLIYQGGRIKIVSTINPVLLFMNGFMPSVLIVILIFLGALANSGIRESLFHHYVTST